ncbi:uncharacterized protein LOC118648517 [Monomorium pharaonis]|uniref:uncharacterized protein LOC105828934 n=1 Tax=Monomorium pharaonis TaxID=307658 RepID=UPI00063F0C90|nr:uncharacterized protein LOC105828934 [Monomorium pharaonis]XP_036150733.1 uncharacterized protein LOC118648517 [Monomorium pharaonis]
MLLLYILFFLSVLVTAQGSQSMNTLDREILRNDSKSSLDRIGESFLNGIETLFPVSKAYAVEGRKDKKLKKLNKYVLPLIIGFLLIKSILLPITLKALAILSGKAVVLSLMSLILAAIVGLKKVAQKDSDYEHNKHRRQDVYGFIGNVQEFEPYRIYKERRRKK